MGSLLEDLDGDGTAAWFVTGINGPGAFCGQGGSRCDGNRCYRWNGTLFERVERENGTVDADWGWDIICWDPDLIGDQDLVVTNGYFSPFLVLAPLGGVAPCDRYRKDATRILVLEPPCRSTKAA